MTYTLTLTAEQIEILKAAVKASTTDSVQSFTQFSRPEVIRLRGSVMMVLDHARDLDKSL